MRAVPLRGDLLTKVGRPLLSVGHLEETLVSHVIWTEEPETRSKFNTELRRLMIFEVRIRLPLCKPSNPEILMDTARLETE